tara:strand:- start:928 stop:2445 length:1518 start_codon:yes stop_codon:yes gene_type:complete
MTQIIIPIVSNSNYFPSEEYFFPKPLIDVDGTPMILKVMSNFEKHLDFDKYIFIMPEILSTKYTLDSIIKLNTTIPTEFVYKKSETNGALCSSLLSIDKIDDDSDLIISNMDEIIDYDLNEILEFYRSNSANAGLISFNSNHPRWVYLDICDDDTVSVCSEKKVISKTAGAGFYYFKNKETYLNSAKDAMLSGNSFDEKFYLSLAINSVILDEGKVFAFKINKNKYHTFYKPKSISDYVDSKNTSYEESYTSEYSLKINIVIPAAGKGSRFKNEGWKNPKPLIDVGGKAMINRVVENVNVNNSKYIILTQNEIINPIKKSLKNASSNSFEFIGLDSYTEGTACTVLKAYELINNDNQLLIANSDQLIDFDCNQIIDKCDREKLDGVILTFKDPTRNPKWSFVKINDKGLVIEVAEKEPISDLATVGIYFFKKGSYYVKGAIKMIINMDKTNDEYYVCPIYNYLIEEGLKIGIINIKESQMHGLGIPDDLNKYLEKNSLPKSLDSP